MHACNSFQEIIDSSCLFSLAEAVGRWIYHVSPALLILLFGAFGLNRFFIRRANSATFADRICNDLKDLSEDLLAYWSSDTEDNSTYRKNRILEQKIKAALQSLNRDIRCFCGKYHKDTLRKFGPLLLELTDAATGGDFESGNNSFRPEKYIIIANRIGEIRSLLMMTKI